MPYDFFELTGVSLEDDRPQIVKAAIDRKVKELGEAMSTSDQSKRREVDAQLKFLQGKRDELFGKDAKFKPVFSAMVKARTAELVKRFDASVKLEAALYSSRVVTVGKLKRIRNDKTLSGGLPLKDIEAVYKANGFTVVEIPPLKNVPVFPTNIEAVHRDLEELRSKVRKDMAINPKRKNADSVTDLYAFVAYISDGAETAKTCRKYSSSQLKAICSDYQKKYAGYPGETIEKFAANIAGQAASHVFDSNEHRKGYDQYILYKDPELQKLFEYIRALDDTLKRKPETAEACIRKIAEVFGDYDVALALYNTEARMQNDPYEPQEAVFTVKCSHCHTLCEFHTATEARKLNKCNNCGEKLYKKCPKGHYVLLSDDRCPDCGYVFPDKEHLTNLIAQAEAALKSGNFTEARRALKEAEISDPSEKSRTSELERRISKAENAYNAPIEKISALIKELKFYEASPLADSLAASRPDPDILRLQSTINKVLLECRRDFASASNVAKANTCLDILTRCKDFKPAIDFLASTPPQPCPTLSASADDENSAISLIWRSSGERGITYSLVRRKGAVFPVNLNDGDIILKNSSLTSYKDTDITPGVSYSYSVFTVRGNLHSSPASATACVMSVVSEVRHTLTDNSLNISWDTPHGCNGVRVSCMAGRSETLIAESASGSAILNGVKFGELYSFFLTAKYPAGLSRRIRYDVTPTPEIKPFTVSASRVENNTYSFSWSLTEPGINIRIMSGNRVIGRARSEMRSIRITLAPDSFHVVKAEISSGGNVMYSMNEIRINTFSPPELDENKTSIEEAIMPSSEGQRRIMRITLAPSVKNPAGITSFACVVRTDGKWATENDVSRNTPYCHFYNAVEAMRSGSVSINTSAGDEESYNVTLFTVYSLNGREIISPPRRATLSRPMNADVFCRVSRSFFGGIKFCVRGEANRPAKRWPGFVVCVSSDGMPVFNPANANAVTVLEVEPFIPNLPSRFMVKEYEFTRKIPKGKELYMFWKDLNPGENFVFRWDINFDGKS